MTRDEYRSEAELGQGLQNGDPDAVTEFVNRFFPRIRTVLRRFMHAAEGCEPADLEDEANDVAYCVVRALAGTEPKTNLRSFVDRVAVTAGIDWLRRKRNEFEVETGGEAAELGRENIHSDFHGGDEFHPHPAVAHDPEIVNLLTEAQQVLKPDQLQLLDLRAQGFEYKEIDVMLGDVNKPVKASTWRQRHKRALDNFHKECDRVVTERPELETLLAAAEERAYARSPKQSLKGSA